MGPLNPVKRRLERAPELFRTLWQQQKCQYPYQSLIPRLFSPHVTAFSIMNADELQIN
jgi:hypothetical protein